VIALAEAPAPREDGGIEGIKQVILDRLSKMPPAEFEQLVGRVLDSIGFRDTQVVGRAGDEGVDVIAYLYSPFVSAKIAFQVKRHAANVGPKDISYLRDRWARRADRLVLVTTSDFTPGAREVASESGHDKPVDLVNGEQLIRVMIANDLGVHTRPKVTYEIDDDYFSGA
jgi:restriction system protein